MKSEEVIAIIKELNLSVGKYVVIGGGSLAIRGLRETKDVDILVTPDLFDELSILYELDPTYESKWNRKRLKSGDIEIYPDLYLEKEKRFFNVEVIINNAEIVKGIPLQPLDNLMLCKLDSGREKDLRDVGLIKQYMTP